MRFKTKFGKAKIMSEKYNVLIVEDDSVSADILVRFLAERSISTFRAKNGTEAVNIIKSSMNIDLVLMDLELPEKNGIVATREIRNIRPKLPIVIQTAFAFDEQKKACKEAGANEFLTKPVNKNELIHSVEKYLK